VESGEPRGAFGAICRCRRGVKGEKVRYLGSILVEICCFSCVFGGEYRRRKSEFMSRDSSVGGVNAP
jgi:hypothetical protein